MAGDLTGTVPNDGVIGTMSNLLSMATQLQLGSKPAKDILAN
jgi:hypothetical protein